MNPVPSPSTEHRATSRVPIGYRVKVVTDDEMIAYASALNVGLGGLLLEPTPSLPVGRPCGVVIFLMDLETGKRVVARGIVVRSDVRGTAIQFTKALEPASRELLEALIHSRTPGDPAFGSDMGAAG